MQMKRDGAAAFVDTIKGPQWGGEESSVGVNVDPGMIAAMQRASLISPAWLAACSATMGSSLTGMAVLAANNITMQASAAPTLWLHCDPPWTALSVRDEQASRAHPVAPKREGACTSKKFFEGAHRC